MRATAREAAPSHSWSACSKQDGGTMARYQQQTRTLAQAEDSQDLESVISQALSAGSANLPALRQGVWTYVGEERHRGTSPGRVIAALTGLIEAHAPSATAERAEVERQVILWCVE